MEHEQCSSSKKFILIGIKCADCLGSCSHIYCLNATANVFMSAADTNATPQFILPNIKGSHCLNEKEGNGVKDPVLVQEGKHGDVPTPLF